MRTKKLRLDELPEYQGRKATCFGVERDSQGNFKRKSDERSLGVLNEYSPGKFEVQCHEGPLAHCDQIIYNGSDKRLFELTGVGLVLNDTTTYRLHQLGFVNEG